MGDLDKKEEEINDDTPLDVPDDKKEEPDPDKKEPPAVKVEDKKEVPASVPALSANGQFTEEQWKELETRTKMNREQILLQWALIQAAQENAPANKLLEKEAGYEIEDKYADYNLYKADVEAELAKKTPQERRNPTVVEDIYFKIKGRKITEGKAPQGTPASSNPSRRVASGVQRGQDSNPAPDDKNKEPKNLSEFDKHVYGKYGFKDEKEWSENKNREISMKDEYEWKPKFRK